MVQLMLNESGVDESVKQIRSRGGMDFLYLLELIVKIMMNAELEHMISAGYYEHVDGRNNYRNGTRKRKWYNTP